MMFELLDKMNEYYNMEQWNTLSSRKKDPIDDHVKWHGDSDISK